MLLLKTRCRIGVLERHPDRRSEAPEGTDIDLGYHIRAGIKEVLKYLVPSPAELNDKGSRRELRPGRLHTGRRPDIPPPPTRRATTGDPLHHRRKERRLWRLVRRLRSRWLPWSGAVRLSAGRDPFLKNVGVKRHETGWR